MRRINESGLNLIKEFEGYRDTAYLCPGNVWTIGWGHTVFVKQGDTCTLAQAERWLRDDVAWAEDTIDGFVDVPLNENQFSALVSWSFNVGRGATISSTLLRLLNEGDYSRVPEQLRRWKRAGGEVSNGLIRRREAEIALWLKPVLVPESDPAPLTFWTFVKRLFGVQP